MKSIIQALAKTESVSDYYFKIGNQYAVSQDMKISMQYSSALCA